jgi:hypothetical protein
LTYSWKLDLPIQNTSFIFFINWCLYSI